MVFSSRADRHRQQIRNSFLVTRFAQRPGEAWMAGHLCEDALRA
jgi:hypothetical protein